jgi:bacteriorhodopsin
MLAKALNPRRMTLGAHTTGTETIVDELPEDKMSVKGLSGKRFLMLALFALAVYINEIPLFGDWRQVQTSSYIEYFFFFPMFYTSIHWLEEVGMYQTMVFSMVFQTLSILVSKSAREQDGA